MTQTQGDTTSSQVPRYQQYGRIFGEASIPDENKLKAAQDISENFESIISSQHYPSFLEHAVPKFLLFLKDGEPQFVQESTQQQLRKLLLEILHRIPSNEHLRPYYKAILTLMFHLLEVDNEENVLVCLRIIIELHKQFRPPLQPEIQHFLQFVKNIYKELSANVKPYFDVVSISTTGYLPAESNGAGTPTAIAPITSGASAPATPSSGTTTEGASKSQTVLPKAVTSLKVLAELPIIVVLMYQLYKQSVHNVVAEFIPLIMNTIVLQPSVTSRKQQNFNKEVYVDFVAAQIKTFSFLAYIVRIYQETVNIHSQSMVAGFLGLLRYMPAEVAHLRKELFIAARHILVTDLRNRFVTHIDQFFNEEVLVGSGWTARESLRPLAYSTLADLVHHVRTHLPLPHLAMAVHLFSRNVHDESLPVSIHIMSCKLLLNLVEGIRQKSTDEQGNGREILMRMLEIFVRKFHYIAKHQLPIIFQKCQQQTDSSGTQSSSGASSTLTSTSSTAASIATSLPPTTPTTPAAPSTPGPSASIPSSLSSTAPPSSTATPSSTAPPSSFAVHAEAHSSHETDKKSSSSGSNDRGSAISVADCRSMVKTLVCGVKTITWGAGSCKLPGAETNPQVAPVQKTFLPRETQIFTRLLKYALQALDIYQISVSSNGTYYVRAPSNQQVRLKEEKEILEHFAGVFTMMNTSTFKEVFISSIEYLVERIHANYALQIIPNSFLANPNTSATFATILVRFLLDKLDEMGTNMERSNLYLKLFKLVFGSVSLFASDNEQMLKPHLHEVVNRSMELACTSKEPYNYFLLLRALFRSIGGGSHDLLYQEFLPLLPNLLQGLNNLQSGVHKQHMKDLFVELCLTVPVRLSSLLPYLPMLMDPLVSALNGSQTLVSQGLRTLELCVDNLQPDFLYDHIQPVRAELFQALWKTLRNPNESIAHVAYRVLGKFGGGNRRMLKEPQKLEYNDTDAVGPCLNVQYPNSEDPVTLHLSAVVDRAVDILKSHSSGAPVAPQPASSPSDTTPFYRKQSWVVVQSFVSSMMSLADTEAGIRNIITHPSFREGSPTIIGKTSIPPCTDVPTKKCFEQALTGVFFSCSIKDLEEEAVPFMCHIIRHYTLIAVTQQTGPYSVKVQKRSGVDVHVMIDALAIVMSHEDKDMCKVGELVMAVMMETTVALLGSKTKASELPLFEYLLEQMCGCCYERAWFAKSGGCYAIRYLLKLMPLGWVIEHQLNFINALMFVMLDLTNEVSAGTVDDAKSILEELLRKCNTPITNDKDKELIAIQQKVLPAITQNLVREIVSPNQTVRKQAQHAVGIIAEITKKTVHDVMEPHKGLLEDMIPPKKHLLRHQPVNTQIALMDGNTFCTTLEPRLFTMDLSITQHQVFFVELHNICEADDATLLKLPCYCKSAQSLTPLRISALNTLSACHYIVQARDKIFNDLYKALNSPISELQEAGKECMKKFMAGHQIDMDQVHVSIRPLLQMLGDYRNLNLSLIQRLSCLMELFPASFNEKLCEQLLAHLKRWMEVCIQNQNQQLQAAKQGRKVEDIDDLKICSAIINMFHLIPAASFRLIDHLIQLVLKAEKALMIEVGSPFRDPLLKFVIRYPPQTVDYFLSHIADSQMNRLLMYYLSQESNKTLRSAMEANPLKIVNSTFTVLQPPEDQVAACQKKLELQYQGIQIVRVLVKFNDQWLAQHAVLVGHLRRIWISESFQERIKKDAAPVHRWREPKLLVKCLLNYVKHRPNEVELLFQILRVFTTRLVPDFQFFQHFLDEDVAKKYTVDQKRAVFFKFIELFHDQNFPQELKGKALQHVIIPMFAASFEKGEGDSLIGGPPSPETDSADNCISVFIKKIIDPDNPFGTSDDVRILLLQFSALLVEHASPHIHDAMNKRQGIKLRRLMTFAWPCLLPKQCVDPAAKYHGHLLLAHIIAKFAIHRKIALQVFLSLLKAHAHEARSVVRQALNILTPAMPARMEDGNTHLTHWTKKIIIEEGHTVAQLVHILTLLVHHFRVYYPVRIHLVQHMVSAMQRLGFTASATIEHRKLAVDLAEVIIKWEAQRIKDEHLQQEVEGTAPTVSVTPTGAVKRTAEETAAAHETKRTRSMSQVIVGKSSAAARAQQQELQSRSPLEKAHADSVANFLVRIACQVNETSTTMGSPGEALSRRCVMLLKMIVRQDVCPAGVEFKLGWMDRLFCTMEQTSQPNYANVCTGLDVLTFLLTVMPNKVMLTIIKPLQRGVATCMTCQNSKVLRSVQGLLQKLMGIVPVERAAKFEELEMLYTSVGKIVYEGLTNYEKTTDGAKTLYGPLMLLKAACFNNPCFIDRFVNPFIKALQKMHKDHITAAQGETAGATDMLILCLDLIKSRLGVMSSEARKLFFVIVSTLIEKSPDAKLLKAITRIVEEWIKARINQMTVQHLPTLREKLSLLGRMMCHYEKRFPDEFELQAQFLDLVNFVYRDETLVHTELAAKLEPAFLAGLRCLQPQIRSRFMEVFDQSIRKKLYDRLLYIFCSQNWESMGNHFWIKQCIELLLAVSVREHALTSSSVCTMIPSLSSVVHSSNNPEAKDTINKTKQDEKLAKVKVKEEPMEVEETETKSDVKKPTLLMMMDSAEDLFAPAKDGCGDLESSTADPQILHKLAAKHAKFLQGIKQESKTATLLGALAHLCHRDTQLAHKTWLSLFPQLWNQLSDKQQQVLSSMLSPFMCSGSHLIQMDSYPSTIHTILEGVGRCSPAVPVRPCILKYLGKTYNIWHRSTLMLEDYAVYCEEYHTPQVPQQQQKVVDYTMYDDEPGDLNPQETLDSLAEMYSLLNEEDMWAGLWQRRCKYPETATAIAYESQGFFEQAQTSYEQVMTKAQEELTRGPAASNTLSEYKLWEEHWLRCSKELGQWDLLMDFGKTKGHTNPLLVLESAWRVPDWQAMKEALAQVEMSFPETIAFRLNLYRGYIAICHPDEQHLNMVEKLVEACTSQAIRQWRRLPHLISHQHVPLLQAAQQIIELQEAAQIHAGLQPQNVGRNASLHDMKAIIKTWRNRLPMPSDDLSHWSDIFMWRHHHYQAIVTAYDSHAQHEAQSNHAMLGVHASAWAIIHYGYIARKQNLTGVCLDSLSRIHTIPSVPIVDCFHKIRQQVKCYLQLAGTMGKTELQEGLEVIESTNLKFFTKEMTAEFFALKGMFLAQIGRSEDANKAFSQAVQMHDTLVKAWALWGDYLDNIFVRERTISMGVNSIVCYLHACRHQNEAKCRKYLARTMWLLTYDDDKGSLAETVEKHCVGVPAVHWLPWIPQLLTCLIGSEGIRILNLLCNIGRVFPQAVYFPVRTLYLTLRIEHRERNKTDPSSQQPKTGTSSTINTSAVTSTTTTANTAQTSTGVTSITVSTGTTSVTSLAASTASVQTCSSTPTITTATTVTHTAATPSSATSTTDSTSSNRSSSTGGVGASQTDPGRIRATDQMVKCSRIMHMLRDLHPTLLSALEGIVEQMVWFRDGWHEEVLHQLRQGLTKCYRVAFETRGDVSNAIITPHTLNFVKKLVSTFGIGFEAGSNVPSSYASAASESLARRAQATAQDPVFQKLKEQFAADFDFSVPGSKSLHNLISKLKKWIKILEAKAKLLPTSFLLEERCRFLSYFSTATAEVELPGEFLMPKANTHSPYYIRIARFMPRVELVQKDSMSARRLFIRGNNGKIYPYLLVSDAFMVESRREERVLQLMRLLNLYLEKRKESCRRHLLFTVPRVVAVSPQMRLIEDNPTSISLKEILRKHISKNSMDSDAPITLYYERLLQLQARGCQVTHQLLRDILKEVQNSLVPDMTLKEWAQDTYSEAVDYWTFRKQFTVQLALASFAEFVLHFTRLNPEMIQIAQDSGRLTFTYFRFEVEDSKGEFDANRPVPFRLTPNISEFISAVGVEGVMSGAIISAARTLVQPQFSIQSILRPIIRDEMMTWYKKKQEELQPATPPADMDSELLINLVTNAVSAITTRLHNVAQFEGGESKVTTLIGAATSLDNLCRMDPVWHPWL